MKNGKRKLKIFAALLTAVIVFAQTISVYAEEVSGTVCVNDFLNIRESADDDADIVEVLHNGDKVTIVATEGEWYKISGNHNGYVHRDYVAIDVDASEDAGEGAEAQQPEAQQPEAQQTPQASQETADNSSKSDVPAEDIRLMAALIACECGAGGYDGKLAVGAVIMNRSRMYGGIREAIYAPYQFGPASSGKLAATLASNAIDPISLKAAQDAAAGANNIGLATHFRNVNCGHAGIVAGNHVFW